MVWANDNLASATAVTGSSGSITPLTYDSTVDPATSETGEDVFGAGETLWWKWTAPSSSDFEFATVGSPSADADPSGLDTKMQVFSGPSSSPTHAGLTFIDNNDDNDAGDTYDYNSRVIFTAVSGTTYYVQVDFYSSGEAGTLHLSWAPYVPPVPPPSATSWAVESGGGGFFHTAYEGDTALVDGTDLAGTSTVTVGGVSVPFDVLSGTQIRVHFTTTTPTGPITLSNSSGSSNAPGDATVYHYGPWIQPADGWGPEQDQSTVPTIVVTQSRTLAALDDPTPDVWYDGPDSSQESYPTTSQRHDYFACDMIQTGDYTDRGDGHQWYGQMAVTAGYVDVNNASSDDRGQLMPAVNPFTAGLVTDPHAVDYETEPSSYVVGTFAGRVRYRLQVIRNNQEIFAPRDYDGSPHHPAWDWHGQLRRLLPGDYNVWAGSGTDVFPAWLFPGDLADRDVVLDFSDRAPGDVVHISHGDGTFPDTALSEELNLYEGAGGAPSYVDLGAVELVADDPGDIVGLIATTSGYAAGDRPSAMTPSDPAGPHDYNVDPPWKDPADNKYKLGGQYVGGGWGPWAVLWSVYYAPPRYRLIYDAPLAPATTGWQVGSIAMT